LKSFTEQQAEKNRREAQELKNNQDFICTTNQWLQKLDLALQSLKDQLIEHRDDVSSKLKYQDISVENLHSKNCEHKKDVNLLLDEYKYQMSFCMNYVKNAKEESNKHFTMISECMGALLSLQETMHKVVKEVSKIRDSISTLPEQFNEKITSQIDSAKKEILALPNEIPSLKKEIADRTSVFEVNFQGLLLEIERLKKQSFVSGKHIEDLYNKISRLKKESQ
jgi:methyl-accepting chemotaxis protein